MKKLLSLVLCFGLATSMVAQDDSRAQEKLAEQIGNLNTTLRVGFGLGALYVFRKPLANIASVALEGFGYVIIAGGASIGSVIVSYKAATIYSNELVEKYKDKTQIPMLFR